MAGQPIYGSGLLSLTPEVSASALSGFQGGLSGAMKKIGTAVAAGFAAAFAVGVAAGIKGIGAWAELEKGMNEVFTLLPGISKDAMGSMTQDVRDFALEFAVLPEDVVPALYNALSAGVPKDTVFDFMEVANKAAVGGVTDLNTAVNGITGVVNAYGADVIDAGTASDLMFTTVRLGKTTFDEMAASLGDVTPIAAAMGVSFEDVSAALAASTAITGNTSKSVTGLKGLISELGKEGQVAAVHFEKAAGQSFPEFIASGGDLAGALDIMKGAADDSGGSIIDLFGSVEAGAAALQLTGSDVFVNNLEEMADSAGATDAAYDTMDSGLSRTWDRIKVTFNDAFLEIGERLAPHIQQFSDWFAERLPVIIENVTVWFETKFLPAVGRVFDFFKTQVVPVIQNQVIPAFQRIGEAVRGAVSWFQSLSPRLQQFIVSIGAAVVAGLAVYKMVKAFQAVGAAFKAMSAVMMANPWALLIAAVVALVALIVMNWDTIKEYLGKAWEWIKSAASSVGSWISEKFKAAVDFVKNLFLNFTPLGLFIKHMDSIKAAVTGVKNWISDRINDIVGFFTKLPGRITKVVSGLFDGIRDAFKSAINWIIKKWNNMSFTIPSVDLGPLGKLGGGTINFPDIPLFHSGIAEVPGPPGSEMLAILEAGERVLSKAEVAETDRPLPDTKGGINIERLEVHNPIGEPTERSLQTAALAVAVSGYVNR